MRGPMMDVLLSEHITASTPQKRVGDLPAIVSFITVSSISCFISVEHYYLEECSQERQGLQGRLCVQCVCMTALD